MTSLIVLNKIEKITNKMSQPSLSKITWEERARKGNAHETLKELEFVFHSANAFKRDYEGKLTPYDFKNLLNKIELEEISFAWACIEADEILK